MNRSTLPPLSAEPLVSCLCVTEGRAAFMAWLLWCYDRQTWPHKELVILDSSPHPFQPEERTDVRVVTLPPGTSVPHKRNLALREAAGEIVAWFDDDDWQHPERLAVLAQALRNGGIFAASRRGWFVDLITRRCQAYLGFRGRTIFNSAGFRLEAARNTIFPENLRTGSDTPWMESLAAHHPGGAVFMERQDLFFWLCHTNNLSNPTRRRHLSEPLERLKTVIGEESWGDTDSALEALQSRILREAPSRPAAIPQRRQSMTTKTKVSLSSIPKPLSSQAPAEAEKDMMPPSIGVMIKATVLDAPYLETMVKHMLAQARYPFTERVIVVDRRLDFSGKYRNRPRMDQQSLDRVLGELLAAKVIDTVRDVDMHPGQVKQVMARYFYESAERVPTHACTGGPIYAALFGLEAMNCDYVLQMDADILFHTGPTSWVSEAFKCLREDPQLWLMMSHPGPPAGPPGKSLVGQNAHSASWDSQRNLWRFRHATTRYFLCDRRRLHGQLRPIFLASGCAPLEQCISHAMQRQGTFRGALGDLESWHLHVWYHGAPFSQWAPTLGKLVEEGHFPEAQRGHYDLRLDQESIRKQWGGLVSASITNRAADRVNHEKIQNPIAQPPDPAKPYAAPTVNTKPVSTVREPQHRSSIAVVIPVRNRAGQRLQNTLGSLNWQTVGRPAQVLVVSHGSQPEVNRELATICGQESASLITIGTTGQPWNKSLALNIGIRSTLSEIPFVMTMDADMILAPNFLEVVWRCLTQDPKTLVLCRISDLDKQISLPSSRDKLLKDFQHIRARARLRGPTGSGGIQAATREFFFEIRGYDEDLLWWGAMDGDIVNRAPYLKMNILWIENQTAMLHQWHPRKYTILRDRHEIEQAQKYWLRNHELVASRRKMPYRNPRGWGGVLDSL